MKRLITLLILTEMATALCAQETWPLERCIDYGLQHNLDIRRQDNQIAAREAELLRRKLDHLPTLGVSIGQDYNWGRSVDMQELVIIRNKLTRATGASLSASVTLFEGLTKHYERLAARKEAEAARFEAESLKEQLTLDITQSYLQLMLAKQIQAITRENYATIVQQRERTARLVDAGSQPKSALGEMEVQVASEKAGMVEADCRVRTAALALARLMNLPPDSTVVTGEVFGSDSIAPRIPVFTESQLNDALRNDARARNARSASEVQRHLQSAVRGTFFPRLTLTAGYGTYYSSAADEPFSTQIDENRNPSLSFQLSIPIFTAGQLLVREKQQRLALETARLEEERVRTEITGEIHSALIEAENSLQQYRSAEETLHAVRDLLAITEARYNLGAATALDYIVARNNHFKAVSDFLQAKWQYLFQLKLLERYRL